MTAIVPYTAAYAAISRASVARVRRDGAASGAGEAGLGRGRSGARGGALRVATRPPWVSPGEVRTVRPVGPRGYHRAGSAGPAPRGRLRVVAPPGLPYSRALDAIASDP